MTGFVGLATDANLFQTFFNENENADNKLKKDITGLAKEIKDISSKTETTVDGKTRTFTQDEQRKAQEQASALIKIAADLSLLVGDRAQTANDIRKKLDSQRDLSEALKNKAEALSKIALKIMNDGADPTKPYEEDKTESDFWLEKTIDGIVNKVNKALYNFEIWIDKDKSGGMRKVVDAIANVSIPVFIFQISPVICLIAVPVGVIFGSCSDKGMIQLNQRIASIFKKTPKTVKVVVVLLGLSQSFFVTQIFVAGAGLMIGSNIGRQYVPLEDLRHYYHKFFGPATSG